MGKASIVFMGFGEIGIFALDCLLARGADIKGVFPRASDRHLTGSTSSLFAHASLLGLNIYPYTNPSDPDFLQHIAHENPDYIVSVQYDRILKEPLIRLAHRGVLNLHFAPLPRLRGCFPTKWAIINNESSGVTLHYIDPGIDTGAIIAQTIVPLAPDETDATLYLKLVAAGKALFADNAEQIVSFTLPPAQQQDDCRASYYPKAIPWNGIIDWSKGALWVERFIRAFTFSPYPAAKTFLGTTEVQIRHPVTICARNIGLPPGRFVFNTDDEILISCGADSLHVRHIIYKDSAVSVSELKNICGTCQQFKEHRDA